LPIQSISYKDGDAHLTGTLVTSTASSAARLGVLVIHGGAGLDAHATKQAERFAQAGYVAFACDMYGEGVRGNRHRVLAEIDALRHDRARLVARAQGALEILRAQVENRVAIVGYCFGGMVALELARAGVDASAIVSVHGTMTTAQPVQPGAIKAAILICQGAADPHCPLDGVLAFATEMKHVGADWELVVYGSAMHGFTHEDANGQTPGVLYDRQADERSLDTICAFLRRVVR
jgi:dienelactone hydrolase